MRHSRSNLGTLAALIRTMPTQVADRPANAQLSTKPGRWKRILVGTAKAIFDMDTSLRCAGTAFFGFLSIFPAIAFIVLAYGLVADRAVLNSTIDSVQFVLPEAALEILKEQLLTLTRQPPASLGVGLFISLVVGLWSGSRGVNALIFAMSRVRGQPEQRGLVETVLISVGLMVAGSVFLIVAVTTIAGLPALTALLPIPSRDQLLLLAVRWPVLLALSFAVVAALYRWGPDRHPRKFRYIWPGALLSSLLWILAGVIFSIYVENFGNFEASFGSVTAAAVLLLWLYNSAQIFVLGAAFNAQIEHEHTGQPPATPS
jgi:membrane protein